MHENNKIGFLRQQINILTRDLDQQLETTEESYSNMADKASVLYEACLWAQNAAWDRHRDIPEVMDIVLKENLSVACALSRLKMDPMNNCVHVRYFFHEGRFFCEGCQRNAQVGCKDGCPMIPRLEIAHDPTDPTT